ncbi:MAG: hypothetical protein GY778_19270 [bacterium]|nr:hypothetical protein [bacterium]
MMAPGTTRADLEFTTGVETQVAESPTILVGQIAGYEQEVKRYAGNSKTMPIDWVVTGELAAPKILKGLMPGDPVRFSREGRSFMLPPPASRVQWEEPYGDLTEDSRVVAFLGPGDPPPVLRVVPTGEGEQDLAGLVADVVRFRKIRSSEEKFKAWTEYLAADQTVQGRRTALRVLSQCGAKWQRLQPHFDKLLSGTKVNSEVRAYAFSIVCYHVTRERWIDEAEDVVEYLCEIFSKESAPDLTLLYLSNLGLIARYSHEARYREEREPLREAVEQCLKGRKKLSQAGGPPAHPEDEEFYKDARAEILEGPEPEPDDSDD